MPTVLVIENDVPAMRLMAWGLMSEGFEVAVAHVPEASDHLHKREPNFIVFNTLKRTDEKARLVMRFRELAPASTIVDISDVPHDNFTEIGADVHLTLPITMAALVETLNQHRR